MGIARVWFVPGLAALLIASVASVAPAQLAVPAAWDDGGKLQLLHRQPTDHELGPCGKARSLAQLYAAGLQPDGSPLPGGDGDGGDGGFGTREATSDTDLQHCKLEIELVPSSGTQNIIGTNTMTVKSLVNGLTQFTFRLRSQFNITTLTVNGVNATWAASGTYGRTITLPSVKNANDVFTVVVGYNGLAVSRGFGSIEFTTLGGNTAVFSLSEAYFAGTWWPVKDGDFGVAGDNSDKFTAEIWITAPTALTSVSNGTLQGIDTLSGSRRRFRWATNYPIAPYLVSIGSTVYAQTNYTYNYTGGSMPVSLYISPGNNTVGNRAVWAKCIDMMAAFAPVFGLYPFINEKYGIYEFTFGGGMEHQTMTGQGGGFSENVTAHELGHQWWGDDVTCRTWGDIWLNEGFATYSEAIWAERQAGSSGTPALLSAMANRRPSTNAGSVYCYNSADMNLIFSSDNSYRKGGWVLHQLRHIVGETNFTGILAAYRAQYQGSAATTADFAAVASSVYGQDLDWFFQEWVMETGAPAYQYGWQTVNINGQNYLRLYLNQTTVGSYGVFTMPVDVRVNWAGGNQTYKVFNDAATEHFVIPIGGAATSIVVDEFNWILNDGKTSVVYVNGPPKVVQASPAPGASFPLASAPSAITVTFSAAVTAVAGDFVVTADGSPVPFTYSYNAGNFTATLNTGALPSGNYTVTVNDSIKAATGAIALDGEITSETLPSGNGLAAGDAVYSFVVESCPSDFNGDGFVDPLDYNAYINAFEAGDISADFNEDGFVDPLDYNGYINAFEAGC